MKRLATLAFLVAPLSAAAVLVPSAVSAQDASAPLAQVANHLRSVNTMVANFSQTGRGGQTLNGVLTLKRPGHVRFQYQRGVPMLIVADGKRLNMVDYETKRVESWPIGNSPLGILLNANPDLSRVARVIRNDPQVLLVSAQDRRRPEFGTLTLSFAKVPSAPGGLMLQGWNMVDAQKNNTTVKLSNQRFNVAVADNAFRYVDPRKRGPRG